MYYVKSYFPTNLMLNSGQTTQCMNKSRAITPSGPSATGLLTDWINTFNFMISKWAR